MNGIKVKSPKDDIAMKQKLVHLYHAMAEAGINGRKIINAAMGISLFLRDLKKIRRQQKTSGVFFPVLQIYPIYKERFTDSGVVSKHYFQQDIFIAQKIFQAKPHKHVDIGSRIDGFIANVASFRVIETFDIRPIEISVKNIVFHQCDLMQKIDEKYYNYCDSLSCLHALEHFGLGRYGDRIQYEGYIKGIDNINKILKTRGKLYLSVPIGPQRIVFNAHRVFSVSYLLKLFKDRYSIDNFSYIDDKGIFHQDISFDEHNISNNYGCIYGCGILEMTKL